MTAKRASVFTRHLDQSAARVFTPDRLGKLTISFFNAFPLTVGASPGHAALLQFLLVFVDDLHTRPAKFTGHLVGFRHLLKVLPAISPLAASGAFVRNLAHGDDGHHVAKPAFELMDDRPRLPRYRVHAASWTKPRIFEISKKLFPPGNGHFVRVPAPPSYHRSHDGFPVPVKVMDMDVLVTVAVPWPTQDGDSVRV